MGVLLGTGWMRCDGGCLGACFGCLQGAWGAVLRVARGGVLGPSFLLFLGVCVVLWGLVGSGCVGGLVQPCDGCAVLYGGGFTWGGGCLLPVLRGALSGVGGLPGSGWGAVPLFAWRGALAR